MAYKAFGTYLMIAEGKSGSMYGGIKVADTGRLKTGTVLSIGHFVDADECEVGCEVAYIAEKAISFDIAGPDIVMVDEEDVVAYKPKEK